MIWAVSWPISVWFFRRSSSVLRLFNSWMWSSMWLICTPTMENSSSVPISTRWSGSVLRMMRISLTSFWMAAALLAAMALRMLSASLYHKRLMTAITPPPISSRAMLWG